MFRETGRAKHHRLTMPLRALLAVLLGCSLLVGATLTSSARGFPTVSWPGAWTNPTGSGGAFVMTTKWGAFSLGCRNADQSNDAGYYLNSGTSAHTGIDMNRGDGQDVYAIADGTVVENGQPWGAANNNVVVVEHTASSGEKFLAVYGHLYGDTAPLGPISRGARIGRVRNAGTGPHLHFGIRPGGWGGATPAGSSASGVDGAGNCSFNPVGTVDPLTYLAARSPGSGAWPPANGTFASVRETGMVFRIAGGAPLYVGSWDRVGGPQPTQAISQAQLDSLPVVPADGTMIAAQPSGRVFRIAGGAPLYISSWGSIGGEQATIGVDDSAVDNAGGGTPWNHLRAAPTDMFLRGWASGRVFRIVSGGHPYYVGSWDPYGGAQPYVDVDDWAIDHCDHLNCNPFGSLDTGTDAGDRVRIAGWAMDPNTTDPIAVHIYVDDTYAGAGTANRPRSDVDAAYHRGDRYGFDFSVAAKVGTHKVCAYGINSDAGGNDLLGCRTATVTPAPKPTTPPTVAGTVRVSSKLTCSPGIWRNASSLSYAWLSNGQPISRASSPTFTVSESLYGKKLACRVTGHNSVASTSSTSTAKSVAVGPALKVRTTPKLSGTAKVGKSLQASTGSWTPAATTYSYRWLRNGASIKSATKRTYKIIKRDKGKKISCTVTASRNGWTTAKHATAQKKIK